MESYLLLYVRVNAGAFENVNKCMEDSMHLPRPFSPKVRILVCSKQRERANWCLNEERAERAAAQTQLKQSVKPLVPTESSCCAGNCCAEARRLALPTRWPSRSRTQTCTLRKWSISQRRWLLGRMAWEKKSTTYSGWEVSMVVSSRIPDRRKRHRTHEEMGKDTRGIPGTGHFAYCQFLCLYKLAMLRDMRRLELADEWSLIDWFRMAYL